MDHLIILLFFWGSLFAEDAKRQSEPQLAERFLAFAGIIAVIEFVRFALEREVVFAALYGILFLVLVKRSLSNEAMRRRNE